ncbi:MAG: radical SAM protein, partial [Thermodesulfobacteriota bacterium]|nr:radical SAM protein [Thermodesulfobacteriota bacterium]
KRLKKHGIHTELVTLIVPTKNDSLDEIKAMCEWIRDTLGPDTPLHFSKFYPLYKLKTLPPTPVATLEAARETAINAGLNFVYIGNVPGHPAENTFCPHCETELIRRIGYQTQVLALNNGKCKKCGREIPGIWGRG